MRSLIFLAAFSLSISSIGAEVLTLAEAWKRVDLRCAFAWNSSGEAAVSVENASAVPVEIVQAAGGIWKSDSARYAAPSALKLSLAAGAKAQCGIPLIALSAKADPWPKSMVPIAERDARLDPVWNYFAQQEKPPLIAMQLAVLCVTENVTFQQWQQFLVSQRAGTVITPTDIVAAVDVLGILREIAPSGSFALATDSELKLRALRNPWCRAKAVELYGLTTPGAPALPPELSTLLHAKPGDNCPVCRLRGPGPDDGF